MGRLLKRLGYIKLSDYGLCLTPEGTVEPLFKPNPMPLPRPARVMEVAVPMPGPAVHAPVVAAAAEPEEDDWEWHIAIARARAVADDIDQAVVELDTPKVVPLEKRKPSNTQPMAAISSKPPVTDKTVPYAENPFHESWEGTSSRTPRAVVKTVARRSSIPGADTIIPVPKMPTMSEPRRLEPVVRSPKGPAPAPMRRVAKGTGPGVVSDETIRMSPTALPPAAVDDATRPGLLLPSITKRAG